MAVTLLKRSRQIFGICSRQISSRCLQANAATFRNFAAASERRGRKNASSLGWTDLEDIRIRTKDKARGRKSKKSNAIAKNRVRERKSTSPPKYSDNTKLSKISREGRPNSPQASDTTKRRVIGRKSSSLPKSDATQSKDRKKRSSSLKKFRDTTKNRIREMRSDRHSRSLAMEKSTGAAKREGKAEAKVMTMDREDSKRRRRAPEAVMWSARTAETMLLYKDGTDKLSVFNICKFLCIMLDNT